LPLQTKPLFKTGPVREVFEVPYDRGSGPMRNYDVTRDGQTFAFVTGTSGRDWRQMNVVLDWATGLARLAAPASKN
jgi:hypothetical protein